jgi:hypothetical protein
VGWGVIPARYPPPGKFQQISAVSKLSTLDSKLVRNDRKLSDDLRKILRFIEMPSEGLELPLDI